MKTCSILFTLILIVILQGCDPAFGFNTQGYVYQELPLLEAWQKTASFQWQDDPDGYFKSPHEFEADGGGDCEDFAAYLMYQLGRDSELCTIYLYSTNGNENEPNHAIVKYHGLFLEPQLVGGYYKSSDFKLFDTYSYNDVMLSATNSGAKNIH